MICGFVRRLPALFALGLTLLLLSASPSKAWGPEGHRIVAKIAEQHLEPKAQRRFALLFKNRVSMADVANWADEIRAERPETASWHYINIPPDATELNLKRDCPADDCITLRIRASVGLVRLGLRGESERQEAMKYLVHFMGDLHQPLHAGYGQDQGGNDTPVIFEDEESGLHAFWDSGLLSRIAADEEAFAESLARSITTEQMREWRKGHLRDWTWESHLLAVRVAYGALPEGNPKVLGDDYVRQATALIRTQLAKAGVRLAEVINQFWAH